VSESRRIFTRNILTITDVDGIYNTLAGRRERREIFSLSIWHQECRDELAKFLSRRYGNPVMREQLILTCGASYGLQLLLNTVVSPNGVIFVEEFTYMIALDAFKQFPLMNIIAGVPKICHLNM